MVGQWMEGVDDHFLVLYLLALVVTRDQNRLPTLLWVEPVSVMVSTLPVKTLSLPILKSTQLSFLMFLSLRRAGFEEISSGESQDGYSFLAYREGTVSRPSSSSIDSLKQGCFSASLALIRSVGLFLSMSFSSSRALRSRPVYSAPSRGMLLSLFCLSTSLQVLPGKALTPSRRTWKMSPRLKMSHMGSYLVFMSLMLMTSGATQPGVPQRTKRYSSASENSASPKSAMTQSLLPSWRKMRFSGLRSRCMMFLLCISESPLRMEWMICLVSWALNRILALILSQMSPPSSSSTTMQSELSDSNTSCSRMQFAWFRFRIISIYFIRHSFPLSSLQAASLENAFTAKFCPVSIFSARYTDAKLPFPIFFLGLNCSWNPR